MITIDTNALIRFFTNDIPKKAKQVKKILEEDRVFVPEVVFPELEYVLTNKLYMGSRETVLKAYMFLINLKNIRTTQYTKIATRIYSQNNLDMADCLIIAHSLENKLFSFDEKMKKVYLQLLNQ